MWKSDAGAAFATTGVTQPVFASANGLIYCDYQFLAAEWAVGDLYKLVVGGITVLIDGDTIYVPTMVWSNAVLEAEDLDTMVEGLVASMSTVISEINLVQATLSTALSEINLVQATLSTALSEINLVQATLSTTLVEIDLVQATLSTHTASLGTLANEVNLVQATLSTALSEINLVQASIATALTEIDLVQATLSTAIASLGTLTNEINLVQATLSTTLSEINLVQASIATALSEINLVQATLSTALLEIDLVQASLSTALSEINLVQASLATANASMASAVDYVSNMSELLLVVGNINMLSPDVDQPNSAIEFTLTDINGAFISDAQITDVGQVDIYRYRKGTDVAWVQKVAAAAPAGTAMGTLNYSYSFPSADWARGDMVQIHISSVEVTKNGKTITVPRVTNYAVLGVNSIIQDWVDGGRLDLLVDGLVASMSTVISEINLVQATLSTIIVEIDLVQASLATSLSEINLVQATLSTIIVEVDLAQATLSTIISEINLVQATLSTVLTEIDLVQASLSTANANILTLETGLEGGTAAVNRAAGRMQIITIPVTSLANAGDVTLATATAQPVIIESLIVQSDAATTASLTNIGVYAGTSKVVTLIDTTTGVLANLNAIDKQVSWTGSVYLPVGRQIVMTLTGGVTAPAVDMNVVIEYRACVNGGYLV
jgi:hypothetical protein